MQPVRVYLDSSDFSVLSNPKGCTEELSGVLAQLKQWVSENRIVCCFSGTHLCEMAPLDVAYSDAAESRASLLVDLCGHNALISQDRLFASELKNTLKLVAQLPVAHSPVGNWYPGGIEFVLPINKLEIAAEIQDVIEGSGMNRTERRAAKRKALKGGKPRPTMHAAILTNARSGSLDEILEKYPMRPEDARVLSRYVVGDASAQDATIAFEASLRDPRWMMQWLGKNGALLNQFTTWIRGPAASMQIHLNDMVQKSASVRRCDADFGTTFADSLFSSSEWLALQDKLLHGIAVRMSKELLSHDASELSVSSIDKDCPGLSVGIRSLHSAWWTTTSQRPRWPKLSDFPDGLHAMYAPYVDIFRADAFMAPHIAKVCDRFGTKVVSKLTQLPSAIQAFLSNRAPDTPPRLLRQQHFDQKASG
jgi:hypothetical protein